MNLPGLPALGEAGLACPLLVGLLAGGPLGRRRLSRTISPTDSALSHEVTGRLGRSRAISDGLPAAPTHLMVRRRFDAYCPLHEIEVPFNGRDQVDLRQPGSRSVRVCAPCVQKSAVLSTAVRARLVAELYWPNAE